ncbi:MAG TPA: S4 domain-containing protein, partial [Burkholderiaceae bacterium]
RNPRDVKVELAQEMVARFHSPQAAQRALADFEARFRQGAVPEDMPEVRLERDGAAGVPIGALLKRAGLAPSTSEALRSVEQGGVRIDGQKVEDRALVVTPGTYVVQIGKRRWARVTVV